MPVTFAELKVDSATFLKWGRMLSDLRQVYTVPLRAVDAIPTIPSLPANLQFSGLELLLDVGLACTRPEVTDDPERLFALLRYGTKLSENNSNLRLVDSVSDLDPHKKKVLSDEFGCGFAFLTARRLLNTNVFLDTTTARKNGLLTTKAPKTQQPDYIGMGAAGGGLVVLEAKGTQTKGYCRKQVKAGCKQVTKVNFKNRAPATRIAIGAELRRQGHNSNTSVFVGDPEEADGHDYVVRVAPEEAIVRSHYARIAALIGDGEMLTRVVGDEHYGGFDLQTRTVKKRAYLGSTLQFRHRNSIVGVFIGIEKDFRRRVMESKQYESVLAETKVVPEGTLPNATDGLAIGHDGTILQLWSKGPLADRITSTDR